MEEEYKLLILHNGKIYISEIHERTKQKIVLKNPMLIEHKYNVESMPNFRYIPWQLISSDSLVEMDLKQIHIIANPKIEMLDIYQRINISFENVL